MSFSDQDSFLNFSPSFSQKSQSQQQKQKEQQQQQQQKQAQVIQMPEFQSNMIQFQLDCITLEKFVDVERYLLDTADDIKKRIALETQSDPSYLFFKDNFLKSKKFLDLKRVFEEEDSKKKKSTRKKPRLMSLSKTVTKPATATKKPQTAISQTQSKKSLHDLFRSECIREYKIDAYQFVKLYFLFLASKQYPFPQNMQDIVLKSIITEELGILQFEQEVFAHNKNKMSPTKFLKHVSETWDYEFLKGLMTTEKNLKQSYQRSLKQMNANSKLYESLKSCTIYNERPLGDISQIEIKTEKTTGQIFDALQLNDMHPMAKYKSFYKLFMENNRFSRIDSLDVYENDNTLKIFNTEGKIYFYIQNSENGVLVQCIFLNQSTINNVKDLCAFLKIQDPEILYKKSIGIMTEFTIANPNPYPNDFQKWSGLEPSIFSNLCMNQNLFSKFININDTDKISRNNHSVFLYFNEYSKKKNQKAQDIYVGGWNKISSRFGDLTAILTPQQEKLKEYTINVKITRSANEAIVASFKKVIAKLISLYNKLYKEQLGLFRSYDPSFEPFYAAVSKETTEDAGFSLDYNIFTSDYKRSCQAPKPVPISEQDAQKIPASKKLLFPPAQKEKFDPIWYKCPDTIWNKKKYLYPGLIELNKINHPFGYAPCCYQKPHTANTAILKEMNFFIKNGVYPYYNQEIDLSKCKKIKEVTENKIINFTNQEGVLPTTLNIFMNLIEPTYLFKRLGTNTWKFESFLGCLEFCKAIQSKSKKMRSPRSLREALLETHLGVGIQQNYDIGIEGIKHILQDPSESIDPRRFIRIVEEFYQVNIIIFSKRDDDISILNPKNYREFYFGSRSAMENRPIVFLIEQSGDEKTLYKYELIVFRKTLDSKVYYSMKYSKDYERIITQNYGTFMADKLITFPKEGPSTNAKQWLTHQLFDIYGKTRILILDNQFPCIVKDTLAPLNLPEYDKKLSLPGQKTLEQFLQSKNLRIHKTYVYKEKIILEVKDFHTLYFFAKPSDGSMTGSTFTNHNLMDVIDIFLFILQDEETSFLNSKLTIRLAYVMQDYIMIEFSFFMQTFQQQAIAQSVDTMIQTFLDHKITFVPLAALPYNSILGLSPRISTNAILFTKSKKLCLPLELKPKLTYFLQWFCISQGHQITGFKKEIELPHYYMFASDFQFHKNHIIQNMDESFDNHPNNHYVNSPLHSIPSTAPFETLFFYYNPQETPRNKPYLAVKFNDKTKGVLHCSHYIMYGSLHIPEGFTTELHYDEGHYEKKQQRNIWQQSGKASFCVFQHKEFYVFLMDFWRG